MARPAAGADPAHTRTKIVATLGPASSDAATLRELIRAGADVFRLNFSHGDHVTHARLIATARRAAAREKRPVALLADLQGPKIRVGRLRDGQPIRLVAGARLVILARAGVVGDSGRIGCSYRRLAHDVHRGARVLLDDGNLEVEVERVRGDEVVTRVVVGGLLREHRGINLPGTVVSAPSLSRKDLADLDFALGQGVDWVALSFVRRPEDVLELKRRIAARSADAGVVAKIERPEAVARIEEILEVSDALLIARGDMGVEIGPEEVPVIQKRLIRMAVAAAKPVITATQMLESMIERPRPTRAEASDVANAIYDGSSAVMLSGETAIGAYPAEAVRTMERIVRRTEGEIANALGGAMEGAVFPPRAAVPAAVPPRVSTVPEATVAAAARAALAFRARVVAVLTEHGRTAHLVARERLPMPAIALTPSKRTYTRLVLEWGTVPVLLAPAADVTALQRSAERAVARLGWVRPGDGVVSIAGELRVSGATDTVRVHVIASRNTARRARNPRKSRKSP